MASFSSSFSSLVILALALILIFVLPSCSTSTRVLDHQWTEIGFKIDLKHVDSDGNFTKLERLQRAMTRGGHRLQRFSAMLLAAGDSEITSTVSPANGEFLMKLSIGTPPKNFSAIVDTGSDLIWTQCKPCKNCFVSPTPIFDPKKSSSFCKLSCSSNLCEALPVSNCGHDGCKYLYTYGDYSFTEGVLATETFTFEKVSVPKIGFGCGEDNEGFNQGDGLVGLGRGPLSLVSQLGVPKFSYCLTSIDDTKSSKLLLGSLASVNNTDGAMKTTPLIQNPSQPSFYYLSLEAIKVGDTRLRINKSTFALKEDGSGGLIIDSGTTITYLEKGAFQLVKKEFISQVNLPVDNSTATANATGLDLCFKYSNGSNVEVPNLAFQFEGADLKLPVENYIIIIADMRLLCLAIVSTSGFSIFGNVQQQNILVVYDLAMETLSFTPKKCDQG